MKHPSVILRSAIHPIIFRPAPVLAVGDGTTLRSLKPEHTDRLYELIEENRSYLQNWLSWISRIQNHSDCYRFLLHVNYRSIYDGRWVYGIWHEEQLVGLLDFNEPNARLQQISLGYWLGEEYQGQGIVTGCVSACIDYLFTIHNVSRIIIKCATDNLRSQAVAQRLNFDWEGLEYQAGEVSGRMVDLNVFVKHKQRWREERGK
ncbi:MAG: GNAT family N-acetyltransferase [Bacteroidota bacterium]